MKKLLLTCALALVAGATSWAQNGCVNYVTNGDFNTTAGPFVFMSNTCPPWTTVNTVDVYPDAFGDPNSRSAFFWSQPSYTETITQTLSCALETGKRYQITFTGRTSANDDGYLRVSFTGGGTQNIDIMVPTNILTQYTTTFIATGNYTTVSWFAVCTGVRMDLVVDGIYVGPPVGTQIKEIRTVDCCAAGGETFILNDSTAYESIKWFKKGNPTPVAQNVGTYFVPNSEPTEIYTEKLVGTYCGLTCMYRDTFITECCGGDEDWLTTNNRTPYSVNDNIYKNGRVGIGTSNIQARLHLTDIGCDEQPAFRITGLNTACLEPDYNGPLFLTEGYDLSMNLVTRMIQLESGSVGIGTAAPTALLSVNGTANKPGGGSWAVFSDERLKTGVAEFKDGLNVLKQMKPVRFHYNGKAGTPTEPEYIGIIAQDMRRIAPYTISTVKTNEGEYLQFDPSSLDFIIVNAIKEQQEQIQQQEEQLAEKEKQMQELDNKIAQLEQALNTCCAASQGHTVQPGIVVPGTVQPAGTEGAALYQNVPNPFSSRTEIKYLLPSTTMDGKIVVFDMNGKQIKSITVRGGSGSIIINGGELTAGMYMYTLIANGREIDTKRMILTD